jgi:hypothetical protein
MRALRLGLFVVSFFVIFIMSACSSQPTSTTASKPAEPEKKLEPALSTAIPCLERMSGQAMRWQADAMPYSMDSVSNEEANGQDGRSTVWHARFASASTLTSKTFNCSGSRLRESPPLGVTGEREVPYRPGLTIMTFSRDRVTVDSDEAAKLAIEHGGDEYIKKDPKQPMVYQLGIDPKSNKLIWLAVVGESQDDSKVVIIVDATQPKFLGGFKRNGGKDEGK